ncbi:hypothetical protein [Idiomarina sp. MD25a]|uniref:hypothetical protein n=1 Tax=Idiomarina sp. MD25a TaxID=1889913 RepID=UPI0009F1A996|nr:hypothetical protein [Idiomarina sp. MD25a]
MINLFRAIVFSTLFFVSGQPYAQQSSSDLSTDLKLDDEQTTQTLVFRAPQDGPLPELVQSILEEAYAELNVELRYEPLPRLRGEQLASEGIIAGELGRIPGLSEQLTNLVRVDFPIYEFSLLLVADPKQCGICTPDTLSNLAYLSGLRSADQVVESYQLDIPIVKPVKLEQVIKLMDAGRVEATLMADFQYRGSALHDRDDLIVYEIQRYQGYHYLHKKYAGLIPDLVQALELMQATGRITALRETYQSKISRPILPIRIPDPLIGASSLVPGQTEVDGEGAIWQRFKQLTADWPQQIETDASNWPRAKQLVDSGKAQVLVGIREEQLDQRFIKTEHALARSEPVYLFTKTQAAIDKTFKQQQQVSLCVAGGHYQQTLLPANASIYNANTSLDCFALLDMGRVEGVVDYAANLPDWTETPYERYALSDEVPLYLAFKDNAQGQLLRSLLDNEIKNATPRP